MSALTDFFTSLANKIRSKLGTSITYSPVDAISAIDDVYDKGVADTKVGNATADLVYRGRTFTNSSGVGLTGTMPSRIRGSAEDADTELTTSDNCPVYVASNSGFATNKDNVDRFYMAIPKNGYYTLNNAVLAVPCQTKNATPDISSQVINPDAGKALWGVVVNAITPQRAPQSVTAGSAGIVDNKPFIWIPYGYYPNQGNDHCGIYTTEAVAQAIHRHTGTYTFAANDTGGTKDLGEFHGYRYVNANNVYYYGRQSVALNGMYLRIDNPSGGSGVSVSPSYISAAKSIIIRIASKSADFTLGYDLIDLYDSNGNNQAFYLSNCTALNTDYTFQFSDNKTIWIAKFHINKPNDITLYYRWTF